MSGTKNKGGAKGGAQKGGKGGAQKGGAAKGAQAQRGGAKKQEAGTSRVDALQAVSTATEVAAAPKEMPRMQKRYLEEVRAAMRQEFGYKNPMQVPKLEKIVLNMGVGEAAADQKKLDAAVAEMAARSRSRRSRRRRSPASRSARAWRSVARSRCARRGCTSSSTGSSPSRCRACATFAASPAKDLTGAGTSRWA
jgi:hypothetical protein